VVVGCETRAVAGRAGAFFDESLARHPRFRTASRTDRVLATGPFDWPVRRAAAAGVLLVGDAAGYYDPFTGEGIFRALRGAEFAAAAADAALHSGDVSAAALRPYDRALRREFASSVRLQHLIEAVVVREPLLGPTVHLLRRSPSLANALIDVTGNVAAASTLLRPRLMARAVRESLLPDELAGC
jgi:flavin-dependent dehydrogenase